MARRRKATRRRRRASFSLIKAAESFAYASILTKGLFNTNPVQFVLGDADLSPSTTWTPSGVQAGAMAAPDTWGATIGADQISLGDIVKDPAFAFNAMIGRGQANLANMAVQSLVVGVTARAFTRILRRPIANVNRNIMKPLLGAGVKL
tara:strand:+ start:240 stop:686 length:447 start_codon:yes stop_codon:yes gene_type:complete